MHTPLDKLSHEGAIYLKAIALCDFKSDRDNELNFKKGDIIQILTCDGILMNHKNDETIWWKGLFQEDEGFFPKDLVLICPSHILSQPTFCSDGMSSLEKVGRVYIDLRSLQRKVPSIINGLRFFAKKAYHLDVLKIQFAMVSQFLEG